MNLKRTLSAIIALAMTAGMSGAVPANAETISSDNNDTNNSKGDVNDEWKAY